MSVLRGRGAFRAMPGRAARQASDIHRARRRPSCWSPAEHTPVRGAGPICSPDSGCSRRGLGAERRSPNCAGIPQKPNAQQNRTVPSRMRCSCLGAVATTRYAASTPLGLEGGWPEDSCPPSQGVIGDHGTAERPLVRLPGTGQRAWPCVGLRLLAGQALQCSRSA
jgi:hypothetical protein